MGVENRRTNIDKTSKEGKTDRRFEIINKPGSFIVAPLNLRYQTLML